MGFCELSKCLLSPLTRPWVHVTVSDVPLHSASLIPKGGLQDGSRAQAHPGRPLEEGSSPRAALPTSTCPGLSG